MMNGIKYDMAKRTKAGKGAILRAIVGAYIAYLAFCAFADAIRSFKALAPDALSPAKAKGARLVFRGVAMSMSNPLTILFFLAFLPGFTTSDSSLSPAFQTFLLGTLFCAIVPFVYLPAIVAVDFFRDRFVGSVKATACLKLASAIMLSAVVVVLVLKTVI